jgi:RNA-directed DNA polymerase
VPRLKKRTALLAKLREIFRRYVSQPVGRVIELINPILRGWVNYFAVGHSSRHDPFVVQKFSIIHALMSCSSS